MSENLALVGQWRHAKLNYVSIWMVTSQTTWCLIDKRFQPTIILIARSYFVSESKVKYSRNIAALSSDFIIDMTDKTTDIYVKSNSWNSNENETYLQPLYIIDYNQLDNMITLFICFYMNWMLGRNKSDTGLYKPFMEGCSEHLETGNVTQVEIHPLVQELLLLEVGSIFLVISSR